VLEFYKKYFKPNKNQIEWDKFVPRTKLAVLLLTFLRRGCKRKLLSLAEPSRPILKEDTFQQENTSTLLVTIQTSTRTRLLKNTAGPTPNGGTQEDGKIFKTPKVLKSPGSKLKKERPNRKIRQELRTSNWKP